MEALKDLAIKQKKILEEEIRELQKEIGKKQKEINALDQIILSDAKIEAKDEKECEKNIACTKDPEKIKVHEKSKREQGQSSNYDEEERAKKYYVIFSGPNRGIYDHWSKAAPFIVGTNVIHKSFLSLQEAKDRLEEYKKSYAESVKQQAPAETSRASKDKMVNLGIIPKIPTINKVQTRTEKQELIKLTQEKFDKNLQFLLNYTDEDRMTSIYPVQIGGYGGPKAISLPEADPLQVYMLFQSGLIHTIYFLDDSMFQFFPIKIQQTVRQYISKILKHREGFLRCYSVIPCFSEEGGEVQNAVQLCQIGISNQNYPDMHAERYEEEDHDILDQFLNNYTLILNKSIKIQGRINYSAKSIIIWSQQAKPPSQEDVRILNEFMKRLVQNKFDYTKEIREAICERLTKEYSEDHVCNICTTEEELQVVEESD